MDSMDELIAWAIKNKEWVLAAATAVAAGAFALVKWLSKKPSTAAVSNTATTGGIAAQTINPQAGEGGVAVVQAGTVIVGAQVDVNAIVDRLLLEAQREKFELSQERDSWRQQAEEAVTALAQLRPASAGDTQSHIDEALKRLALGESKEAEAIFQTIVDRKEPNIQQAAEAYRHIGALAFLHDTRKALDAYRRATELDPENVVGWNRYGHLLFRVGDLNGAEKAFREVLRLGQGNNEQKTVAIAYGNLGSVYMTRGDLDQAEAMYRKALAIFEVLGSEEGMANGYGGLGIVYKDRGDLDQAEAMYKKALAIDEELGHKEGMANQYGNLGIVYKDRGDLDQAEAMYKKALAIDEELGHEEGMASDYGNLGNVYMTRGDLDQAEAMHKKALAIDEVLGSKKGMAKSYGNLGDVHKSRGDLDQAEAMWKKSVLLFREIEAVPMENKVQGYLDSLTKERELSDLELTE